MAGCSAAGRAPNQPESISYVAKKLDRRLSFDSSRIGAWLVVVSWARGGSLPCRRRSCVRIAGQSGGGGTQVELAERLFVIDLCETLRWYFCLTIWESKSFELTSLEEGTSCAVKRVCPVAETYETSAKVNGKLHLSRSPDSLRSSPTHPLT
jgi:hypothetical protein